MVPVLITAHVDITPADEFRNDSADEHCCSDRNGRAGFDDHLAVDLHLALSYPRLDDVSRVLRMLL